MRNELINDSPNLAAGLALAAKGFKVLPVCPALTGCGSKTCKQGKHPLIKNWQAQASSDEAIIRKWFKKYPVAGVGIATGEGSDAFVIDTDGTQGQQSLEHLMEQHNWKPNTLTATTGRGRHYYFKYPSAKVISRAGIAPGLDVRGHSGFVVAPPSQHVNGNQYKWIDANAPIAEAPDWLVKLVSEPKSTRTSAQPKIKTDHVENLVIAKGDRHAELARIAGGLRANGIEEPEILEHLCGVNRDSCKPPLSDAEVSKIAASISKLPAGKSKSSYAVRRATRENALPYFPCYVNDWLGDRDLMFMDAEQIGWYLMLAFESWRSGGILEDEPDKLWKLARAESRSVFERKLDAVLTKFDAMSDEQGRPILVHRIIAALWKRQRKVWKSKVDAGKASAEKRQQQAAANATDSAAA